ncbi:MAG: acetoacetyl-CoA reductase [Rhodospirillales bacterium]|nr:acetoacetyl-CoA reductase [Rhodospirillales bacterium]MDE2458982.1 acetoacetyl-CoA reductase [Rhodospirillales bacterium]
MTRLALVTGGTRGIGAAISRELARVGYRVAAVYLGNAESAEALRQEIGCAVFKWDVADYLACEAGVHNVVRTFGGPIEILVNNAGITRDVMLHKMSPQQWDSVITCDLTSCFNMCHATIGTMREHGFGRIINVSSINGQKGQVGQTNYSAAKAGMIGFTKALALESAAKGITVNAIAPGYIATDMVTAVSTEVLQGIQAQIPIGRFGQPDEIARIVTFLVSEEAKFITGATITANGGQYMA